MKHRVYKINTARLKIKSNYKIIYKEIKEIIDFRD
uniref:Uncharacterized protein n=1 Tax=Corynecladia elata TaxID=3101723 RepID=A0AA51NGF3_9FLOR|nr:hypothetical protein RU988_pgp067 [Laurencia elata]WMP12727.1 hypothetical protein [Laurencia elata]